MQRSYLTLFGLEQCHKMSKAQLTTPQRVNISTTGYIMCDENPKYHQKMNVTKLAERAGKFILYLYLSVNKTPYLPLGIKKMHLPLRISTLLLTIKN